MLSMGKLTRTAAALATAAVTLAAPTAIAFGSDVTDAPSPSATNTPDPSGTADPSAAPSDTPTPAETVTPSESPSPPPDVEAAAECYAWVEVLPGVHEYVNICETPGDDDEGEDEDEGEHEGEPTCDLSNDPFSEFCDGQRACRADIPSSVPEDNWPEPAPSESAIFTFYECIDPPDGEPEGEYGYIEPYEDSLPDDGWAAFGRLETPAFTLNFEPANMTYVGADTTFNVNGIGDGEITGSRAGPLQAVGKFSHIEIDTGESGGNMQCDNDPETDDCEHVYLETSHEQPHDDLDGRPAYTAQARLVYDVTYLMDGEQINIPGVPDTLESPWNGTLVPVGEIQTLVQ